jgi:hypothetical protein
MASISASEIRNTVASNISTLSITEPNRGMNDAELIASMASNSNLSAGRCLQASSTERYCILSDPERHVGDINKMTPSVSCIAAGGGDLMGSPKKSLSTLVAPSIDWSSSVATGASPSGSSVSLAT